MNIALFLKRFSLFKAGRNINYYAKMLVQYRFSSSASRTIKQYQIDHLYQSQMMTSFLNRNQDAPIEVTQKKSNQMNNASSQAKRREDQICLIKQKIEQIGKSFELCHELGCLYQQSMNFRESLSCFREALKLSPDNAQVYNNMGVILKQMGQNSQSFRAFSQALSLDDQNHQIYNNLGNFYLYELNDIQEAIKCFYNGANLTPELAEQYLEAGHIQSTKERYWESLSYYINAYLRDLQNQSTAIILKNTFIKGELIEQAKLFYNFLIDNEIHSFSVFFSYGSLLFEAGQIESCKNYLQKAQQINFSHYQNNLLLAIAQFQNGDTQTAVQLLENCLKIKPNDANALNYLGIINTQIGNTPKAVEYLTLLLSINQNDVVALTGLGSIQIDTNQIEVGLSNLKKAIQIDNLYFPAHQKLGEETQAKEILETSRKIQELQRKSKQSN